MDDFFRGKIEVFLKEKGQSPEMIEKFLKIFEETDPINEISTMELSEHLSKREGITKIEVPPYVRVSIKVYNETSEKEMVTTGPATILVNQD